MSELFLRQIHPSYLSANGELQSRSFVPTAKDEGKLSVDDSTKTSAENSYRHFTENLGLQSAGTWAISRGEINSHEALKIEESPLPDNPAHCSIDFTGVTTKGRIKRIAQTLAAMASARGCLFEG